MPYATLRLDFDALAADLFGNGYMMAGRERLSLVQELHGLALQVLDAAHSLPDAVKIRAHVSTIIRRANSMTTDATHAELLRERFAMTQPRPAATTLSSTQVAHRGNLISPFS